MTRILTFLTLLLLVGVLAYEHHTITALRGDVEAYRSRIYDLEDAVAREQASLAVINKFVLANHNKIKGLQRKKMLTVTAYSPREQETDDTPHITAANRRVRPGIVAVSRDLFESGWVFGKKVYIKNLGIFTIEDLMASHKTNQIDIFMGDTGSAINFGKKKLEVALLDL